MRFLNKFFDLKLIKIPFFISVIFLIFNENNAYIEDTKEKIEKEEKNITIEVDVHGCEGKLGPSVLTRGIKEVLPYQTGKCTFIPSDTILNIFYFLILKSGAKKDITKY